MDVDQIIDKVKKTYAGLETYQDCGYVDTLMYPGTEKERLTRRPFTTYFRKPNLFLFEWEDKFFENSPVRHHAIWCDGKTAFNKWPEKKAEIVSRLLLSSVDQDLSMAIAGATGISSGAAHNTLALLLPDVGGRKSTDIRQGAILDDEDLDGEICYRIKSADTDGHESILHISKERLVILKIDEKYIVGKHEALEDDAHIEKKHPSHTKPEPFAVHQQTFYKNVQLNQDIPLDVFTNPKLKD